jgi:beta-glucosidase-like glycosyl hydrolase
MGEKVWIGLVVLMSLGLQGMAQTKKSLWVDSVFNTLDLSAKIGQLLMVPANSAEEDEIDRVSSLIKNHEIGGIVLTAGSPVIQSKFINDLQQETKVPLLVGMNAEEGVGAVLDSALKFPPPLMLGALHNDSLLYFLGDEIGRQLQHLGVHVNFAPTANLSSSLQNENLFYSAYGEDKQRVANRIVYYQA